MSKYFKIRFKNLIIFGFIILIVVELTLRMVWGFTDTVLFREDKKCEYIQIPQKRKRFGNLNYYNSFSQRNSEISDKDSIITFFGDSIINGGVLIDQDSLATTKLTNYLSLKTRRPVKVLNIAAGSWGPDNCYGYLQEYGNFNTKEIVLVVSSHDAYDDMNFEKEVGVNPQFPVKQYPLAIMELIDRYGIKRFFRSSGPESLGINKKTDSSLFNPGFNEFYQYTKFHNIPFLIYLHAERIERELGKYNEQGNEIINFCKQRNIQLVKELDYNLPSRAYIDKIHLNSLGQERIFEILKEILLKQTMQFLESSSKK